MNNIAASGILGSLSIISVVFCCFYLLLIIFSLAMTIFWIWMIVDLATRDDNNFGESFKDNPKVIWLLIVLFTSWIGGLIYYFMIYKKYPKIK